MPVRLLLSLAATVGLSFNTAAAFAQAPAPYSQASPGGLPTVVQAATGYERLSGRNNPALTYFGGGAAPVYAPRQQATSRPAPLPTPTGPIAKPFSGGVQQASNLSPYLGLDARETETSLPNYFLYVRPQLEQQQFNQVQQAEYRKLQQQVRTASAPGMATNPGVGAPTTGRSAQFMNSGGYYPTLQR